MMTMDLSGSSIGSLSGLRLPLLEELRASDCGLTDSTLPFPSLRLAELHGNLLTAIPDIPAGCPDLVHLLMDNNRVTVLDAARLPSGRGSGLRTLSIAGNGLESLVGLEGLAGLRELRVDDNRLGTLPVEVLGGLRSLVVLSAARNSIEGIEGVAKLDALEVLDLSWNRLGLLGDLEPLRGAGSLRALRIQGNEARDYTYEEVLEICPGLKELDDTEYSAEDRVRASLHVRERREARGLGQGSPLPTTRAARRLRELRGNPEILCQGLPDLATPHVPPRRLHDGTEFRFRVTFSQDRAEREARRRLAERRASAGRASADNDQREIEMLEYDSEGSQPDLDLERRPRGPLEDTIAPDDPELLEELDALLAGSRLPHLIEIEWSAPQGGEPRPVRLEQQVWLDEAIRLHGWPLTAVSPYAYETAHDSVVDALFVALTSPSAPENVHSAHQGVPSLPIGDLESNTGVAISDRYSELFAAERSDGEWTDDDEEEQEV